MKLIASTLIAASLIAGAAHAERREAIARLKATSCPARPPMS